MIGWGGLQIGFMDTGVAAYSSASCMTNLVWILPALVKLLEKPSGVKCCYWKGLAEVRSHEWQVANYLISTTLTNDVPFGSIVCLYVCMQIY